MTLWRMEWARLFRTRRWIGLLAGYLFFGLLGPVITRYQKEIFKSLGGGIKVIVPTPIPADGIDSYVKNASQIGLLVAVVIAAGALALDSKPEWSAFLRTRARGVSQLLWPRFAANAVAASTAFLAGALAAWYETSLLIGGVPAFAMIAGILCGAVYLAFALGVVALVTGLTRSAIGAIGLSLVALLFLPLLGVLPALEPWVPSKLVGALGELVRGAPASDYVRAIAVSVALTAAALSGASQLASRREP